MSNKDSLSEFKTKIGRITDTNFGDYSRKAQTYLNQFKYSLQAPTRELVLELLDLEKHITFEYSQDLDGSILEIRSKIQVMETLV